MGGGAEKTASIVSWTSGRTGLPDNPLADPYVQPEKDNQSEPYVMLFMMNYFCR